MMDSAPGVSPGTGEMPGAGSPQEGYAPQSGVVSDAVATSGDEVEEGAEGTLGPPPAPAPAQPEIVTAPPGTPTSQRQQEIVHAAGYFLQQGQAIQAEMPQIQAAKAALEQYLLPYAHNPQLYNQLPYELQQNVQQSVNRWQQLSARQSELERGWGVIVEKTPVL